MTTLISFLGKNTSDKQTGYRQANYDFADGKAREVPFFGMGLLDFAKPDKLILLGTSGSMWDVFFDHQQTDDEATLALVEAVSNQTISQDMLAIHEQRLTEKLGIPVQCVLISHARNEAEQATILTDLASILAPGEKIILDVTHGFRHLPMLALVAARYLSRVRSVSVEAVYYGALEMTDPETKLTPVLDLSTMLHMLDWVEALSIYDKDGDYSEFAPFYMRAGNAVAARNLQTSAFFERTNQVGNARSPLREFRCDMAQTVSPMTLLFQPEMDARTQWVDKQNYTERQEALAWQNLSRRDYLRAATLGFESIVSRLVRSRQPNGDPMQHHQRDRVKSMLDEEVRNAGRSGRLSEAQSAYRDLREIRNALAHGSRSSFAEIQRIIGSETELKNALERLLQAVRNIR